MRAPRKAIAVIVGLGALGALTGCAKPAASDQSGERAMSGETIQTVLERHADRLVALPGVAGTGIGECDGRPCIKVFVVKKTRQLVQRIPATLDGFRVVVEETGEIRALDAP